MARLRTPACTYDSYLKNIVTKQKQAIRILGNAKYNAHTEPIFKKLNILPFNDLCVFFKVQFMQRFTNGFLPKSFEQTWTTNRYRLPNQSHIELRNSNNLFVPFARNSTISKMPLFSFPKIWENFPCEQIKILRDKSEFNFELKKHFLSLLNATPNCQRLFCPSCCS